MFTFEVTPDDGDKYKVTAKTRDILRWEKSGKGHALSTLMESMKLADLYPVAYFASVRQGLFTGDLAKFEESVDLEFKTEEVDPTSAEVSPSA